MSTRISQIFALIVVFILTNCGLYPAEQASAATQGAAYITAALTFQAPAATSISTAQPTLEPAKTLKLNLTSTPDLSSMALTLHDLPAGFETLRSFYLRNWEEDTPKGSSAFGFQDFQHPQTVLGILEPCTSPAKQAEFDTLLLQYLQSVAAGVGEVENSAPLLGLDEIGETRAGISAASKAQNLFIRWDIIAFRRGEVCVTLYVIYPDGDKPEISVKDLGLLQDKRIQNFLSGNGSASTNI